jgi:type II secretory pathway predicted ATPase ExeA
MSKKYKALFGLKWNPFSREIPVEGCFTTEEVDRFCEKVIRLTDEGGFAMISGESGMGKSVTLRLLCARFENRRDIDVRELSRPQSSVADFYRELGALYDVALSAHNRYNGAKALREQWLGHIETSLARPVLVIDEAQEMHVPLLNELRLLTAAQFDSRSLLTVVLAGDDRLPASFNTAALAPLGTRIRTRLTLKPMEPASLAAHLHHVMSEAGQPQLMTASLVKTLSEHAAGNLRILMNMANDLFEEALRRELQRLDETLYFDVFRDARELQTEKAGADPRRKRGAR